MIPARRSDRDLAELLGDLAGDTYPAYVDVILEQSVAVRQRPAWSFVSRWLPTERAPAALRTVTGRTVLVKMLLLTALVAGLLYAGARRPPAQRLLPPPFGPADNGLVMYTRDGDVRTVDPVSGEDRLVIGGPEVDSDAGFSPDGTRILFLRTIRDEPWLMVADASGADIHPILDRPALGVLSGSWNPDGAAVTLVSDINGRPRISVHPVSGTSITTLDLGLDATWPMFRPPDGRQLLFRGVKDSVVDLYLVRPDGTGLTPLNRQSLALTGAELDLLGPGWSPDGGLITYHTVDPVPGGGNQVALHVFDPDTREDRVISPQPANVNQGWAVWSPDGRWIAVQRWEFGGTGRFAIIPSDGRGAGHEINLGTRLDDGAWIAEWAPDSTRVLEFFDRGTGLLSVDPATGQYTKLPWPVEQPVTWQRLGRWP